VLTAAPRSAVVATCRQRCRVAVPKKPTSGPLISYARVSSHGQDLAQQRAALPGAGCSRVFEEKVSGAKRDRPRLERLLDHLRVGDVVAVTRLDRLARSTRDLWEIAERIKDAGAAFALGA
jgi:DNA invertase Pin-like site-specific DNA recombinase